MGTPQMLVSATINKLMAYKDSTLNAFQIFHTNEIWGLPIIIKHANRCPLAMALISYHLNTSVKRFGKNAFVLFPKKIHHQSFVFVEAC